jgi:hypothetical protein
VPTECRVAVKAASASCFWFSEGIVGGWLLVILIVIVIVVLVVVGYICSSAGGMGKDVFGGGIYSSPLGGR